ncbi:MAG TPA: hypothetical protein DEH25_02215 [Chloroflexi bacterium]|nr:hypothetical protein [Chloroflexota bacterium]HBY08843.1 hypothetical protein [Chloroflexota bacterium]
MWNTNLATFSKRLRLQRGLLFGLLIVGALLAFELFNYSTTDFALSDLLGDLTFLGIRWATILSLAFCGIDFAGIARLFTPEQGRDEPAEVWYLFGAWMLAATMNAMLTWWGVSIAILNHQSLGTAVVASGTLLKVVPLFVAVMVWLTRVLIIGTLSVAGDRIFSQVDMRKPASSAAQKPYARPAQTSSQAASRPAPSQASALPRGVTRGVSAASYRSYQPAPKPEPTYENDSHSHEPVYTPVSFSGNQNNNRQTRF